MTVGPQPTPEDLREPGDLRDPGDLSDLGGLGDPGDQSSENAKWPTR